MIGGITISIAAAIRGWAACWPLSRASHGAADRADLAGDIGGEGTGQPGKQAALGRAPNSIYIVEPAVSRPAPRS